MVQQPKLMTSMPLLPPPACIHRDQMYQNLKLFFASFYSSFELDVLLWAPMLFSSKLPPCIFDTFPYLIQTLRFDDDYSCFRAWRINVPQNQLTLVYQRPNEQSSQDGGNWVLCEFQNVAIGTSLDALSNVATRLIYATHSESLCKAFGPNNLQLL